MRRKEKVVSVAGAVAGIRDGAFLAIGGFMIHNHPMALVREIIKKGVRDLTILPVPPGGSMDADLLIGAGCVRRVLASYVGAEWIAPVMPNYRQKIERKEIEVVDYDELTIICGLRAAIQKLPCEVTRSGLGTDLLKVNPHLKKIKDPFTGAELVAVAPIKPDVAIIHAQRSDPYGNIQHHGSVFMDAFIASAAGEVIVSVEEVVPPGAIIRDPFKTTVPCHLVSMVTQIPFGAHPCSSHGYYNYDEEHLKLYVAAARDPGTYRKYLDRYVYGPEDIADYTERVGAREGCPANQ